MCLSFVLVLNDSLFYRITISVFYRVVLVSMFLLMWCSQVFCFPDASVCCFSLFFLYVFAVLACGLGFGFCLSRLLFWFCSLRLLWLCLW